MSISLLPTEILEHIFKLLKITKRVKSRLVCSYWRDILDNTNMWKNLGLHYRICIPRKSAGVWLLKYTNVFDNINSAKLFVIQDNKHENKKMRWYLDNYELDKNFAFTLLIYLIKNCHLKTLKLVIPIIKHKFPKLVDKNPCEIYESIDFKSIDDNKLQWILLNCFDREANDDGDRESSYEYYLTIVHDEIYRLTRRGCLKSAELLYETMKIYFKPDYDLSPHINNQNVMRNFIRVFELSEKTEYSMINKLVLMSDQKSLAWIWTEMKILRANKSEWDIKENLIRSAKIVHSIIKYVTEFSQLLWVVRSFDPVLRAIGYDDESVAEYVNKKFLGINPYNLPFTLQELDYRMQFYIMAGNPMKFKHIFDIYKRNIKNKDKFSGWCDIARFYPSKTIYEIINSEL